jgi:hypothetical protein
VKAAEPWESEGVVTGRNFVARRVRVKQHGAIMGMQNALQQRGVGASPPRVCHSGVTRESEAAPSRRRGDESIERGVTVIPEIAKPIKT